MGMHYAHHHRWGVSGKCRSINCESERCAGKVVQFRRGRPLEMRCKARASTKGGLCIRCDERERQMAEKAEIGA